MTKQVWNFLKANSPKVPPSDPLAVAIGQEILRQLQVGRVAYCLVDGRPVRISKVDGSIRVEEITPQ